MGDSLQDQLLGLGFKKSETVDRHPKAGNSQKMPTGAIRPGKHTRREHKQSGAGRATADATRDRSEKSLRERRTDHKQAHSKRPGAEIDLSKAYAIRAQTEKQERIRAEQIKQEQARQRREARACLTRLLQDKVLNDPTADIARHFDYGGKIKRIHVTAAQLKALNAGELGVVQLNGRYVLVDAATVAQVEAIFPAAIALKVDPEAPAADEAYVDPQYRIPDDLIW